MPLILAGLVLLSLFPSLSMAQIDDERYTDVTVTAQRNIVHAGESVDIATTIKLDPHWHVYWLNPGDSGLPVEIDWKTPQGFEFSSINWPMPDKIIFDILANYGYYDQVTLLQTLQLPPSLPDGKIELSADVRMLVCNEICVPETQTVTLTLNDPDATQTDLAASFAVTKAAIPPTQEGSFSFYEDGQDLVFSLPTDNSEILSHAKNNAIEFFPYDYGLIVYVEEPKISVDNNVITLRHKRGDQSLKDIKTLNGVLALQDGLKSKAGYFITATHDQNKIVQIPMIKAEEKTAAAQTPEPVSDINLMTALISAFLGGLILNLMPCVFPVLSIKALSLVKMKEKERKLARKYGISYTAGVILSFLAVGGAFLALKHTGLSIGWGFQLQNPVVVGLLAYMLFIIGLNLIGLFEIGSRLGNVGNRLTQGNGISNSFFTGVLATIVATPCTAPFMGAAMGFAIVQPAVIALLIFATLGAGLAFPYLFLSFVPAAQKILPRPGAWMNSFKQFLAFPMFASSIWMIWVLDQQAGSFGILLVLLGMLSIAFAIWLARHQAKGFIGVLNHILFFICLAMPVLSLTYLKTMPMEGIAPVAHNSEKYSKAALETALNGDDPVFVEMTAAWCITCKFNHAIALNIDSTKKHFEEKKIRYFIGDWTNYDKEITDYLETFNRNGVPIYMFYGARDLHTGNRPQPVLLPQVLTPAIVENTITN